MVVAVSLIAMWNLRLFERRFHHLLRGISAWHSVLCDEERPPSVMQTLGASLYTGVNS